MAGFDLGSAVEELSYDFTTGSGGWDPANGPGKGVIPDPSRKQIVEFQKASVSALGLDASASQQDIIDALSGLGPEEAELVADAMLDSLSALCQGSPSRAELGALSVRGLAAFSGYVHGQLSETVPTQPAPGTSRSLAVVKSA